MTLVLAITNNNWQGAEKRFARIYLGLKARGHDPYLVINHSLARQLGDVDEFGLELRSDIRANKVFVLPFHQVPISHVRRFLGIAAAVRFVRGRPKPIRVHAAMNWRLATALARYTDARVVFEVTSPDMADVVASPAIVDQLRRFDSVNAVSPSVAARLAGKVALRRGNIRLTTSPLPLFIPTQGNLTATDFEGKENLIVYASRFVARKNPVLFAQAASVLLDRHPQWRVMMLGRGPLEGEVRGILKRHCDAGKAQVIFTPNIYPILKRSRIYCSVITPDNYPSQSILEAMSMGNALVANLLGNTGRFLRDNNGMACELSVESVADTIGALVADPARVRAMGEASVRLTQTEFSQDVYLAYLLSLYDGHVTPQILSPLVDAAAPA